MEVFTIYSVFGGINQIWSPIPSPKKMLLDRLQLLGDGAREAAVRRDWAVWVEVAAARDMRAQAVCLQQGRNIRRAGFGLIEEIFIGLTYCDKSASPFDLL